MTWTLGAAFLKVLILSYRNLHLFISIYTNMNWFTLNAVLEGALLETVNTYLIILNTYIIKN